MVNNPMLFAAIMILWLVALPPFQIISSVSGTFNVMCLVGPATLCIIILCSLEAFIIAWWAQQSTEYKM